MKNFLVALAVLVLVQGMGSVKGASLAEAARPDSSNLAGGVLIAHYPTGMQYTNTDVCEFYSSGYALTSAEQQVNRIDVTDTGTLVTWFVISAWNEPKKFCGVEFGIGNYDEAGFAMMLSACGPCGTGFDPLEIPTGAWPGPGTGIALATPAGPWRGNYVPVYFFSGYAYAPGTKIELTINPTEPPPPPFAGWANCDTPPVPASAGCLGAMGILQDGTFCEPNPNPARACCLGATCAMLTEQDCQVAGGIWYPDQTCTHFHCPDPHVCCVEEECVFVEEDACADLGGDWYPAWDSCSPNPCPRIYEVRPDGTGDFPTIQRAIDCASNRDIIELTNGVFRGLGNRDLDLLGKAITIRSRDDNPDSCLIDCEGAPGNPHRAFLFHSGEGNATRLRGLTILNGFMSGAGPIGRGGAIICGNASPTIEYCVFLGNTASDGCGINCEFGASPHLSHCTFHTNTVRTLAGGCVACRNNSSPQLDHVVITSTVAGAAVTCDASSQPSLQCSDLHGNAGGDWSGCIASQLGTEGNISEDPLFCDALAGRLHLACDSPCLLGTSCSPMGALGLGCSLFGISSVADVGNDQGRQVRITWHRACDDAAGADTTITGYSIWRRIDAGRASPPGNRPDQPTFAGGLRFPPGEWDYVTMIPACGEVEYHAVCPTLCDSTADAGVCWSTFFVRAHTPAPPVRIDSEPLAGYSVDNLAPNPPENLRLPDPRTLQWDESRDADFDYFTVYGSEQEGLDESAERIGHTSGTEMDISGHSFPYYHVTTCDFAGNEGRPATIHNTGAVVDPGAIPSVHELQTCQPNPFKGLTRVRFALPQAGQVSIKIYDAGGRMVRTLVEEHLPAASYSVFWTGADSQGRQLHSGVYMIRMEAGRFTKTERAVILE
jgi:hypothetical protein